MGNRGVAAETIPSGEAGPAAAVCPWPPQPLTASVSKRQAVPEAPFMTTRVLASGPDLPWAALADVRRAAIGKDR